MNPDIEDLTDIGVAAMIVAAFLFFIGAFTFTSSLIWVALTVFLVSVIYESYLIDLEEEGDAGVTVKRE